MEKTPKGGGDHPGEGTPHRGSGEPSPDVLETVLGRLAAITSGPSARAVIAEVLAATLLAFTRTSSVRDPLPETAPGSAEEALAVLAGVDHLRASLAAMDAAWQVAAEQRIRRDDADRGVTPSEQGRGAGQEIAMARRISPAAASLSQAKARRLVQDMPGTVDTLWAGAMTAQQASAIAAGVDGAGAETCRRIDGHIREHPETLHGKGCRRLQAEVRAMVQHLEPETSRERAERAARARHVRMVPLDDGMARVTAVLRGVDAVGLMHSLRTRAESLRAGGERTSVSALEADLLVEDVLRAAQGAEGEGAAQGTPVDGAAPNDAASGADSGARPARRPRLRPGLDVGIVITDTALLGREDDAEPAQLEGYGTLPAHIVRDTLLGRPPGSLRDPVQEHPDEQVTAFYRRLYTRPSTGDLVAMESRAREFPAGLARMLSWRDTTCRSPWCNARIRHSDHVVPHHRGGPTSFANGQGLCARCNLLKEHGPWLVTASGPAPGGTPAGADPAEPPAGWGWISRHGATGISPTPPLLPREPDPRPPCGELGNETGETSEVGEIGEADAADPGGSGPPPAPPSPPG